MIRPTSSTGNERVTASAPDPRLLDLAAKLIWWKPPEEALADERRFLLSLQARGVQGLEQGPFVRELRELVMLIREPDTELVSRLAVLQREFANSQLRAVPCPAQ